MDHVFSGHGDHGSPQIIFFLFLLLTILVSPLKYFCVTVLSTFHTNTLGYYSPFHPLSLSLWRKNTLKTLANRSIVHLFYYMIHKLYKDNVFLRFCISVSKLWKKCLGFALFSSIIFGSLSFHQELQRLRTLRNLAAFDDYILSFVLSPEIRISSM